MFMMIKGTLGALALTMPTVAKMMKSAGAKNTDRFLDDTSGATKKQESQGGSLPVARANGIARDDSPDLTSAASDT